MESNTKKSHLLQQDHTLQQNGISLQKPERASGLNSPKLAILAAIVGGLLSTQPITAEATLQQEPPKAQTTITRAPQGNEKSLKTALLSHRIHEALVAEHLLRTSPEGINHQTEAPKHFLPIPGYVDPNNPPPDSRIGRSGRLEQNIIQTADQLHPALLKQLTGPISQAILIHLGQTAKDQSELWPQNRNRLAQSIQKIWETQKNQESTPFNRLDTIDQEKYKRMADGLMFVTTLEKHIDHLERISQLTLKEEETRNPAPPREIAKRIQQIKASQRILQDTPLETIPQQVLSHLLETTPEKVLKEVKLLLANPQPQQKASRTSNLLPTI